jgi:ribonuclease HI
MDTKNTENTKDTKTYIIYTDGAARGNPGRAGYAAIICSGEEVVEIGGYEAVATNNQMELRAPIEALRTLPANVTVTLYTDSAYVAKGATAWLSGWKRNHWQTATKQPVLNRELWHMLDEELEKRGVVWYRVHGHEGVVGNERCDAIATSYADGQPEKLYKGSLQGYEHKKAFSTDVVRALQEGTSRASSEGTGSHVSASSRRGPGYSYVSVVKGVACVHATWPECERRVKGVPGALYKKTLNAADENEVKAALIKKSLEP